MGGTCCSTKNVMNPSIGKDSSSEGSYMKFHNHPQTSVSGAPKTDIHTPAEQSREDPPKESKSPRKFPKEALSLATQGSGYSSKNNPFLARPSQFVKKAPTPPPAFPQLQYTLGELIGKGAFGEVYQAMDQNSGQIIAVKRVNVNSSKANKQKIVREIKNLKNEIETLRSLSDEHIVQYIGFDVDLQNHSVEIIMEYVPRSLKYVLSQFGALNEQLVKIYSLQILQGLSYLHSQGIIHRDLKCANILIDNDGTCKLSDFGASLKISSTDQSSNELTGSPYWMAPEVIKQAGHSFPADIWSFGCVIVELLSGRPPWSQYDLQIPFLLAKIASENGPPPYPDNISTDCRNFLDLCFRRDPSRRPNCAELLTHQFMEDAKRLQDESIQDPGTGESAELLEMIQSQTPPIYRLASKGMPQFAKKRPIAQHIEKDLLQNRRASQDELNKPLTESEKALLIQRSKEREELEKKYENNPNFLHNLLKQSPGDNDGVATGKGIDEWPSHEQSTVWPSHVPQPLLHENKVIDTRLASQMRAVEEKKEEERRQKNEEMRRIYEEELQQFFANKKKERRSTEENKQRANVDPSYPRTHY